MATTSFTIYSRYDPEKDRERLQHETGQLLGTDEENESGDDQLWREAASAQFLRIQRPPPQFVPATLSYEVGSSKPGSSKPGTPHEALLDSSLSSWYRSLTMANSTGTIIHQPQPDTTPMPAKAVQGAEEIFKNRPQKDKNNWFIQKVLQSEHPSAASTPPPTLPDILAREPPPLPSEPKYSPPVWTEIGPSNRGFTMLQKGGWNEGEALGIGARQRPPTGTLVTSGKQKEKTEAVEGIVDRASWISSKELRDSLSDVREEGHEIIDLTLSDSEESSEGDWEGGGDVKVEDLVEHSQGSEYLSKEGNSEDIWAHGRKALLTPIATVLKLDRLGIGLKAKTEGPHRASVKRVTHSAASLAAHVRSAEEARKRRKIFGRGSRGYERQKRKEEERRRNLLAYMNS